MYQQPALPGKGKIMKRESTDYKTGKKRSLAVVAFLLVLVMMLQLAACAKDPASSSTGDTTETGSPSATAATGSTSGPDDTEQPDSTSGPADTEQPDETTGPADTENPDETTGPVDTESPDDFVDTPVEGVWAEYYNGKNLDEFVSAEEKDTIGGSWGENAPPVKGMNRTNYSIKFSGRIKAPYTGSYIFTTNSDDGVTLTIDGQEVIYDAGPHFPERRSGVIELEEGKFYDIVAVYYNGELGGSLELSWQYGDNPEEIIPDGAIYLPMYPVQLEFGYTDDAETITASVARDGSDEYTLVVEKYDSDGKLLTTKKEKRPQDALQWKVDDVVNGEGVSYKAYVKDGEGMTVSVICTRKHKEDYRVTVDPDEKTGDVSSLLYGSCMEDVNHELYGGIWSQMIFGESFEEEANATEGSGFTAAGGKWGTAVENGENMIVVTRADGGPKLLMDDSVCTSGSFSADVYFDGEGAGFLVLTSNASAGADSFDGYEVTLFNNFVRIAKHMHNYTRISDTPCNAPVRTWVNLRVEIVDGLIIVYVNGTRLASYRDPDPITEGAFGMRAWNSSAKYKNITLAVNGGEEKPVEIPSFSANVSVSGMWKAETTGNADVSAEVITDDVFSGKQDQRITFTSGTGTISINNMGLSRKGMNFVAGKDYNGYIYARSENGVKVRVAFESADGKVRYASTEFTVKGSGYAKYSFSLTPDQSDSAGRFVIELFEPGTVDIGYVFLEPGEWGLYKGLHVRRDVGEMLENQGLTVFRFGGCMANASGYKWKYMTGEPEFRPPYDGWWYDYSSFGFGIIEFLDLCEALGVVAIPDFTSYEDPADMRDFVMFALGTDTNNEWVKLRIEMGHPEPYDLKYIEIGNEDRVDMAFAERFNAIANAIWEVNDTLTLIVGDFDYHDVIVDPYNVTGAASGITNLNGQKSILENAVEHDRPVYFDTHFWSENETEPAKFFPTAVSFYNALKTMCPEADTAICVLELNANAHDFERALCNAYAMNRAERMSDIIKIMCSANALQVDKCNDNGWDQGLIFMDNDSVWYQAPAYMDIMLSDVHLENTVAYSSNDNINNAYFDVTVTASDDARTVCVKILNRTGSDKGVTIALDGIKNADMELVTFTADSIYDKNTSDEPENIKPADPVVTADALSDGEVLVSVAGYSMTTIIFTVK